MSPELDKKLCEKYPKIFVDRSASLQVSLMAFGFEHSDGWYNIIDKLCSNIQHHVDWSREQRASDLRYNRALKRALRGDKQGLIHFYSVNGKISEGTLKWIDETTPTASVRRVKEKVEQVVAMQIKEKFGTLRFYYNGGDDAIEGMVRMAESMSAVTCEECGTPGKIYTGGWYRTLCERHARESGREVDDIDGENYVE